MNLMTACVEVLAATLSEMATWQENGEATE